MEMFPDWADADTSRRLPSMRAQGEGQTLEYMQFLPKQLSDLAKEIAAFATSNDGLILLGVADDGELVGLLDARTQEERDLLCRRVEGICTEIVSPSITPVVHFLQESGKTVMALSVGKGPEPVYYSNGRPYLRHLTQSRPARPHEVVRLVLASRGITEDKRPDPLLALGERVGSTICHMVEAGMRHEDRQPHDFSMLGSYFKQSAQDFRELAATDIGVGSGWGPELLTLAEKAGRVADLQPYLGEHSRDEFSSAITAAIKCADQFYNSRVLPLSVSPELIDKANAELRRYTRELSEIAAKLAADGAPVRMGDLQRHFNSVGFSLGHLAWWGLHRNPPEVVSNLKNIARELFKTEFIETYADGGVSERALVDHMIKTATDLSTLASQIEQGKW